VLDGGAGADTLAGGLGNDTYLFGKGDGQDIITLDNDAAAGKLNTLEFKAGVLASEVTVARVGTALVASIIGTMDTVTVQSFFESDNSANANNPIQQFKFSDGTIWSLALIQSKLDAGGGTAGNDTLIGTTGADNLTGGLGNDRYAVNHIGDVVTELLGEGTDTVEANVSYALTANVENLLLTGSAVINGSGNALDNVITGNAASNNLYGHAGNDTLDGAGGPNKMYGGLGNDTYYVAKATDGVYENANEGADLVLSTSDYELGLNTENMTLLGTTAINGLGNTIDNVLTGNSAGNTLTGRAGNDTLDGGLGADTLVGGVGDDTYIVDNTGDVVTEFVSEGMDTVNASVSWTLGGNVENLTLTGAAATNGTGNTLANVLTGNAAANVLDGGAGVDTMAGGLGNDTFVIDNLADMVVEAADGGIDVVQASVTSVLALNVENLTLSGVADINGTGNTLANVLTGNAAANVLDGGAGADTLAGGLGNDTYLFGKGDGQDIITLDNDAAAGKLNTLEFKSGVLASEVTLTRSGLALVVSIAGTADAITIQSFFDTEDPLNINNPIQQFRFSDSAIWSLPMIQSKLNNGSTVANTTFAGTTGADTMAGGLGNDTYTVNHAGDVVIELPNEGADLVQSSISHTLAANVENLTLTGTGAINGTGNGLNNTIRGNNGQNVLDGGAGADTLLGGLGNDIYFVDDAADSVLENSNEGGDTVNSSISYTLNANFEVLTLTGTAAINGTGNDLANTIWGNSASNVIDGAGGANKMYGGGGNDTYMVAKATDSVFENANEGVDLVLSTATYELGSNTENMTLIGTVAINGIGNTMNNVLTGNIASNTLTGAAGNDTLDGSLGADILAGGIGSDTYLLGRGYGADLVTENDATSGNTDLALFGSSIAADQLWFRQTGNDLEVSIIGTEDKLNVSNWYLGNQYHVEQFKTSDGRTLLDSQVQNLVQAMAQFAPPAAGQTTLSSGYSTSLSPVIAANWQ
jgi:Ca2+-binding RTX toxin-like protein